jgi:hypothetical protein
LLLADYEGKVNADALSRLAEAKDQEAEREEREFQRILAKLTQYSAEEVTAKLREMPEGVTAQQQLEEADTVFYEATRKLGPLKNRLNSIKVEFDTADQKFQELSKTASMPVLDIQEAVDVHLARAAEARGKCHEHGQFAAEFDAEADNLTQRLKAVVHENEKL